MELANGGNSSNTQYGVEKLVGTNYKYWRMCMEAFLQGQDLWDLVTGVDAEIPADIQENVEARRKWKIKCGKALFALRTSISKEFIDHVRDVNSPKQLWETLERVFSKKNTARLQFLENDLASLTQGNMSISEYFLKVKSICAEISELDVEEKISEARIRRFLIRGLKKEYIPFVTSIQGWAHQPSVEEFESLLSNQEALAKQMAKSLDPEAVLFSKGKHYKKYAYHKSNKDETNKGKATVNYSVQNQSVVKCYRCGKPGHIKKYCRVKLSKVNVASEKDDDDQIKWEQCFTVEVDEGPTQIQALSNTTKYEKEWIIDSGCSHHVTGNDSLFSEMRQHKMDRIIVTADDSAYPVAKEGDVQIGIDDRNSVKLNDVFHVPGLKRNLVSVAQITDSGKYVLFGPKDVKVLDNMKNISADVLTTGEKKGSLYVLSAGEAYVKKTSQTDSAEIWHARLGHVGYQLLRQISSKKLLDGIPVLHEVREAVICQGCQFGKSHCLPFEESSSRKLTMFELVHTDLMGPMKTPSYSGYHYAMVLIDDYSRYTWVKFLKEKSEALSKFVEFNNGVQNEFGKKIKCLRSDNGGEYTSDEFFQYCSDNGILRQMTCPKTPQQNGVSERKFAHLASVSLSWLHDKSLPRELWAEAFQCACHVINRLPPWPGTTKSPFELLYDEKPKVNYLRVFGSICYVHVPKSDRTKLDPKAKKCVFVGYDSCRKGWRCMDPEIKKFVVSRNVVFDEVSSDFSPHKNSVHLRFDADSDQICLEKQPENDLQTSNNNECPASNSKQVLRRSPRETRLPSHFQDYEVQLNQCTVVSCFFTAGMDEEPANFEEAKGCPEWESAMDEEIEALNKNQTWELVPKPENCKPVTCKWVYRLKRKSDGTVDRCKARLVARGFSQSYGLDYEETYSPVAKMVTLRTIFSLVAMRGWKSWQLDVKNAFLYGELDREVFMEQPAGYVSDQYPYHVCHLKKALYGLKQAPRAWYGKVAQFLIFCGFKVSDADSSLFIKLESNICMLVLLYVDDMIITGNNDAEISMLKNELSVRFEMKNLGEVFNMRESKEKSTPMETHLKLKKDEGELLKDLDPKGLGTGDSLADSVAALGRTASMDFFSPPLTLPVSVLVEV
ncbi:hypothetical protein GQ457_10G000190 [Hibiscus cannabinus]